MFSGKVANAARTAPALGAVGDVVGDVVGVLIRGKVTPLTINGARQVASGKFFFSLFLLCA